LNISKFGKDFKSPFIGGQINFANHSNDSDESDKLSYKGETNNFTRLGRKS